MLAHCVVGVVGGGGGVVGVAEWSTAVIRDQVRDHDVATGLVLLGFGTEIPPLVLYGIRELA